MKPDEYVFNDVTAPQGVNNVKEISEIKWYKANCF